MTGFAGLTKTSATVLYKLTESQGTTGLDRFRKDPMVKREVDAFRERIGNVGSVEDVFKDYKVMSFVLTASNLGDEVQYPGRAQRILSETAENTDALMNRLTDKRWKSAAEALKFGETGVTTLKSAETIDALAEAYVKIKYEEQLGKQNMAVPYARAFKERIAEAETYYDILGDKVLRDVVTTALGLPAEIAYQEVETQAAALESRVKLEDFKDPAFLEKFTQRYLILKDQKDQAASGGSQSWLLNLFA
jgi:hypothetical protein